MGVYHSRPATCTLTHFWQVDHYSAFNSDDLNLDQCLKSSSFSPYKDDQDRARFELLLYPRGDKSHNPTNRSVSLYLRAHFSDQTTKVRLRLKVGYFKWFDTSRVRPVDVEELSEVLGHGQQCGWEQFPVVEVDDEDRPTRFPPLIDDKLVLYCEVTLELAKGHTFRDTSKIWTKFVTCDPVREWPLSKCLSYVSGRTLQTWTHTELATEKLIESFTIRDYCVKRAKQRAGPPKNRHMQFYSEFKNRAKTAIFRMLINFNGNCEADEDFLSLYIHYCAASSLPVVRCHVQFFLHDSNGQRRVNGAFFTVFPKPNQTGYESRGLGYARFIAYETLMAHIGTLLPGDNLTICCEVLLFGALKTLSWSDPEESSCEPNLLTLLKPGVRLTEVILVIGGRKSPVKGISAYKEVLAARSPVFKEMFSHHTWLEDTTNRVELPNEEPEVFELFLHFLYSDKLEPEKLQQNAEKLFALAQKYNLKPLLVTCERALLSKLSSATAFKYLQLAHKYDAESLLENILIYLYRDIPSFFTSDQFESLKQRNPPLYKYATKWLEDD